MINLNSKTNFSTWKISYHDELAAGLDKVAVDTVGGAALVVALVSVDQAVQHQLRLRAPHHYAYIKSIFEHVENCKKKNTHNLDLSPAP